MKNDIDAQFLCKDCARFNQCKYYDRRNEDSYICKYFHLTETYKASNGDVLLGLFDGLVIHDDPAMKKYTIPMTYDFWDAPYEKGDRSEGHREEDS